MLSKDQLHTSISDYLLSCGLDNTAKFFRVEPYIISKTNFIKWEEMLNDLLILIRLLNQKGLLKPVKNNNYLAGVDEVRKKNVYPVIARPDCIISDGKLKIIELNFDSGLGGLSQISYINNMYSRSNEYCGYEFPSLTNGYASLIRDVSQGIGVVLAYTSKVTDKTVVSMQEFSRSIELVTGVPCHATYFENIDLENRSLVQNKKIRYDTIIRMNWLEGNDDEARKFASFTYDAEMLGIKILSDCRDTSIEDKGALADLCALRHESPKIFSDRQHEIIKNNIAETFHFESFLKKESINGLTERKVSLVLKSMFTSGGEDVYVGKYLSDEEWSKCIEQAMTSPESWVIQEYVSPDKCKICVNNEKFSYVDEPFVISPYIIGGKISAILIRNLYGNNHKGVSGLKSKAPMGIQAVGVDNNDR